MTVRIMAALVALAAMAGQPAEGRVGAPPEPRPRVAATYSSWQNGSFTYREAYDALLGELGWPLLRVENRQLRRVIEDLGHTDIFCGLPLFNYDHAQPYEQHAPAWRTFLQRGGILIAPDCNYGQQQGWLASLGDGLALGSTLCTAGGGPIAVTAPADPWAPDPGLAAPWAHFVNVGPGWTVLARCPDGHPVCLSARAGRGLIIATNLYTDVGYPSADMLRRGWRAHYPALMDPAAAAALDPGAPSVGANRVTVSPSAAAPGAALRLELREPEAPWRLAGEAVAGTAGASVAYRLAPGPHEKRITLLVGGRAVWWTTLPHHAPDLRTPAAALLADLHRLPVAPPADPRVAASARLRAALSALMGRLDALEAGEAGERTLRDWAACADQLTALTRGVRAAAARAGVVRRLTAGRRGQRIPPFVVLRSDPLVKLFGDQAPGGPWSGPVRMDTARGEGESAQVAIVALEDRPLQARARLEPFVGPGGARLPATALELRRVAWVHVPAPSPGAEAGIHWWPDPLMPAAAPFTLRQVCQPLWLDCFTPRSAPPGLYRGAIVVEAGGIRQRVPVELRVRRFALPATHSLRQVWAFRASLVASKYRLSQGDGYRTAFPVERFLPLMDVCLKRRIGLAVFGAEGAGGVAVPWLREKRGPAGWEFDFSQTDRVWERTRAAGSRTLLCGIGGGELADPARRPAFEEYFTAYVRALRAHLKQKGWLSEAVYYMVDEPWSEAAVTANVRIAEIMDREAPDIKRLMTAPKDPRLMAKAHVWVPGNLPEAHPDSPEEVERLAAWTRAGAEMWWYICCGPTHPYPNFFVDYPAVDPRVVFWLTWKYGRTGFLYWGVEYQGDPGEMTPDGPGPAYSMGPARGGVGDGTLGYWGPGLAFHPSIRMNAIRDGIEDYEYLTLLRRAVERAAPAPAGWLARARAALAVDPRVLRATTGPSPRFAYSLDPAAIRAARRALADLLEAAPRP